LRLVRRADLEQIGQVANALGLPIEGKELVASLEASTKELRARVRIRLD
jgi:ABC-type Fe3+-hydroxamate transport system substrate-binding protein